MLIMSAVCVYHVQFWTQQILNICFPDTVKYEAGIKVVC